MTAEDFKAWREQLGLSQIKAAKVLGLSRSTVNLYELGNRWDEGRPVEIPRVVALACAAIFHRLEPWGEVTTAEDKSGAEEVISRRRSVRRKAPP